MRERTNELVKVLFDLGSNAWHGNATETVWAENVTQNRFRLRNVPFYAFGVSNEDVVFAEKDGHAFVFTGVSIRAGHSTYRIILNETTQGWDFDNAWRPLEELGCIYEEGPGALKAVDVPSSVDIAQVYQLLEAGESDGVWDFEEGHCGHPVRRVE